MASSKGQAKGKGHVDGHGGHGGHHVVAGSPHGSAHHEDNHATQGPPGHTPMHGGAGNLPG